MERDLAKSLIKPQLKNYLQNKGIKTGKPFRCLSRSHEDKNPSMSFDNKREKVRCFSCGVDWDIFDVIGDEYGLTSNKDKFDKAYSLFGVDINNSYSQSKDAYQFDNKHQPLNDNDPKYKAEAEEIKEDLKPFFLQAQANLGDLDCIAYLSKRGISLEIARKYKLGYVKGWKSPTVVREGKNSPATSRIIIPTSQYSYTARDTRGKESIPKKQIGFTKMKVGNVSIFNIDALARGEPCFVTEGEFDALSFLEIGVNAIAIGSTSNTTLLLKKLETLPTCCPLILALDPDDSGKKATIKLEEGLKNQNRPYFVFELGNSKHKDANDFLVEDRETFKQRVNECIRGLNERLSIDAQGEMEEFEIKRQEFFQRKAAYRLEAFRESKELSRDEKPISTGFTKLDDVLGGGLYDALYVIGAISSLGKTTFSLQIADCIASQGRDVLYFSLEMSEFEIMAKSISRHTHEYCKSNGRALTLAKSARQISTGANYKDFSDHEYDIIYCAEENYKKYADKLMIHEGGDKLGIAEIKAAIKEYQKYTGNIPVVIVDYLQILDPDNDRMNDKQNIDNAVKKLKRISRDFKTPVIAISSLNRQSYKSKIGMEAFKESGAIEYSCDVLIGLQLKGAGGDAFDVDFAKSHELRDIELKMLKNRSGKTGASIDFKYLTRVNFFTEVA